VTDGSNGFRVGRGVGGTGLKVRPGGDATGDDVFLASAMPPDIMDQKVVGFDVRLPGWPSAAAGEFVAEVVAGEGTGAGFAGTASAPGVATGLSVGTVGGFGVESAVGGFAQAMPV